MFTTVAFLFTLFVISQFIARSKFFWIVSERISFLFNTLLLSSINFLLAFNLSISGSDSHVAWKNRSLALFDAFVNLATFIPLAVPYNVAAVGCFPFLIYCSIYLLASKSVELFGLKLVSASNQYCAYISGAAFHCVPACVGANVGSKYHLILFIRLGSIGRSL